MDFYHSWIYIHILNATWFIWSVVIIVFGLNIISPVILWFVMSGKPIPYLDKIFSQSESKGTSESKNE